MGYFFPTDFEDVVQRNYLQAAQHSALYPPRDPPFPQPLLFDCFTIYSRLGSNPRPMAHKTTALTTELGAALQLKPLFLQFPAGVS